MKKRTFTLQTLFSKIPKSRKPLFGLFLFLGISLLSGVELIGQCQNSNLGVLVSPQPSYTTCAVSNNGSLDAVGFNGTPGYTYAWSNGQTSATATGLGVGAYTVTVTDAAGCTAEATGTVELHPEGIWLMTSTTTSCGNSASGSATVSAMLGTDPYTYLWSDGQTTKTATGLSPGDYSVTVTDALGCQGIAMVTVSAGPAISLFTTSSYETCVGSNDGTATVIASNGTDPYTYLWSDGQTTNPAVGLGAGVYGVTVTDANGCTASTSEEVELSPEGIWIMVSGTDANCGSNDGTAYVGVMTGVPPYTYQWDDPATQTTQSPTGLAPGTYSVTVTDSNGCTAVGSVTIGSAGSNLNVTISSVNVGCNNLGSADANVTNGSGNYTYLWSNGGTTASIGDLNEGNYTVSVTDVASQCVGTAMVTITNDCSPTCDATPGTLSPNPTGSCIPTGGSVDITATHTPGTVPAGYQTIYVLTSGTGLVIQATSASPDFNINTAGTYTIHTLVYDPATLDLSIVVPGVTTGFDVNSLLIQGGGSICGALDVSGAGFDLSNDPTVAINGPYATCPGTPVQMTATTTGTGLSYAWSVNGGSFDNPSSASPFYTMMTPGTYTVTLDITTADGCTASATTEVTVESSLDVSINPEDAVTCVGQTINFSSNVSSGSGLSYAWSASAGTFDDPTSATPVYSMMVPGTYDITLTVTSNNGCSGSATTTVTIDPNPTVEISPTNPSICSGEQISFTTNATGTGLTYNWTATGGSFDDPSSANPNYTMMAAGTYSVTVEVTSANGCTASASTQVTVNSAPTLSITPSGNNSICPGESLTVNAMATGAGPLSYSWTATGGSFDDPSSASPSYTMMTPGTYTLTVVVTDANGCTNSGSTEVTVNDAPTVSIDPTTATGCGSISVDYAATASGVGTLSYLWTATGGAFSDPTSATPTYTMMTPGTYTITVQVTDDHGCTASATATATVTPEITSCSAAVTSSYLEGVDISTLGGSDGSASASVVGGTAPYTYLWSDGQTTQEATGLSAGTYTVTITDAGGCTCEASVTLMDPAKLGNYVWEDIDQDGIQGPGEPPIEGVKVTLTGTSNTGLAIMRMMTTDATGMYMFDGLLPGDYKVTFETPTGYTGTRPNWGVDDTVDSDADPAMGGMTQTVSLSSGEYNPTLDAGFYLCSNVGDYVWYDEDHDGIQDPNETGVADVKVKLFAAGPDGVLCTADDEMVDMTTTDANGAYLLECVSPGEYYISFMDLPTDWTFSSNDQGGDDTLDSDADPSTGKTPPFTVTYGQPDDLTIDAGIRPICNQFVGDGGEIALNGNPDCICPGEVPVDIINITEPVGGSGPIQYMWMFSTVDVPFDTNFWKPIPGAPDLPTYQSGPLFETTYFIRCARRLDCDYFVESNTVTICVKDPMDCPSPFSADALNFTAEVVDGEHVQLNWEMGPELDNYNFFIERSYDGKFWTEIGNLPGKGNQLADNAYDYLDLNTRKGYNIYRIRVVGLVTGINYSQELNILISDDILAKIYPNPFVNNLNLEPIQNWESDGIIEVFESSGRLVATYDLTQGKDIVELNLNKVTSEGIYLIRVTYTNSGKSSTFKVLRN